MFQTQIHILAVLLLAAGLAIETCRLITSHADRFHLLVRRTVPYLIALVAALGLCVRAWKLIPSARQKVAACSRRSQCPTDRP